MLNYEFEKKRLFGLLGRHLVETFKEYNCFIAGGTITSLFCNREVNDFDVYFRSEKDLIAFVYEIWGTDNWIVSSTDKATAINMGGKDVQLIHFRYFESTDDIFKTFDYTACMGAFDFQSEEFSLHPDFLRHNSQRVLNYNPETAFPIVSLLRVAKYQDKGYSISKAELIKVILSCMNLDINSWDELKDQVGGMYGVNYDKMFEDVQEEEFSLEKAIEYISNLSHEVTYYEYPEPMNFDSVEDFLRKIVKDIKFYYFTLPNADGAKYFLILPNGDLESLYHKPEDAIEIDPYEYFSDLKFYKFVRKTEVGRYKSYHDPSFYYEIGTEVEPRNGYLYFNAYGDLSHSTFYDREDKVCLEVEVDISDIAQLSDYRREVRVRKCRVIREVPEGEWIKHRKIRNADELPF